MRSAVGRVGHKIANSNALIVNGFGALGGLGCLLANELKKLAGATGLEPATFGVTGRIKSNGINGGCNIFFA